MKIIINRIFLIIILSSLLMSCSSLVLQARNNKNTSRLIKDEMAMDYYHKLIGVWHSKQKIIGPKSRVIIQHSKLYIEANSARLEVLNGEKGIVNLIFEGRERYNSYGNIALEFTFKPIEWSKNEFNHMEPEPTLAKGKIIITFDKSNLLPPQISAKGKGKHSYLPLGMLDRPYKKSYSSKKSLPSSRSMFYYTDWSNGKKISKERHKNKLQTLIKTLSSRGGWKCISQTEFIIPQTKRKTVSGRVNIYGQKMYLFFSPNGMPDLTYHLSSGYAYNSYDRYDYPILVSKSGSNVGGYRFHFEFDSTKWDKTKYHPPKQVKMFTLTRGLGDSSTSPCDAELRTPLFNSKQIGLAKIFAAAFLDKKQQEAFINENNLLFIIAGRTRNALMVEGLKDIAPSLNDKQIGIIARLSFDILKADLIGTAISVKREQDFQNKLKNATSGNEREWIEIEDVIKDLIIMKGRAKLNN